MKIYVLLECWYEGDSYLVDDSLVAISDNVQKLVNKAHELSKAPFIYYPGETVVDDGYYGDPRTRYRIIETVLL